MNPRPLRIGLFDSGLEAHWPQFPGLKTRLEGYLARIESKLALLCEFGPRFPGIFACLTFIGSRT